MRPGLLLALLLLVPAAPAFASPLGQAVVLGPRLELDGLAIRPPAGFWPLEVVGSETGALAPGAPGAPRRLLLAMLREPDAVFTVSRIETPFDDAPGARDRLARAALDQARDALGVDLGLDWAENAFGGVHLAGHYELAGRKRGLLLAFVPLGGETAVVALAAPAEAIPALEPAFDTVLRTLEPLDEEEPRPTKGLWLVAAASLFGGGAVASMMRHRAPPPTKRRPR